MDLSVISIARGGLHRDPALPDRAHSWDYGTASARSTFSVGTVDYEVDRWGVVHQSDLCVTQVYDYEYVHSRYDLLPDHGAAISWLRAGFIIGVIGQPLNVLDIGYGNGEFLHAIGQYGTRCYGCDISGYRLPEGCEPVDWDCVMLRPWSLVTLFDSLEHMPAIEWMRSIDARYVAITVPWYHPQKGLDWFASWKHRRPGEHLHHFSPSSLVRWMSHCHYDVLSVAPVEDAIRKPDGVLPNTFTAVFRRSE